MSVGSLNGASLALRSLTVGGSPITGANSGTKVDSILTPSSATPITGAVSFLGSGVSASGNTITFAGGGGSGIPELTTFPATASTGATDVVFSATISRDAGSDTAVFTAGSGSMTLALNVTPGGAGGATSLTGDAVGSVATTASSIAVSVSGSAQTGVLTTASEMVLPPPGGGGGLAPIAYGIAVPGAGTVPAWSGAGVAYTLTLSNAIFTSTAKAGTVPVTLYQNLVLSCSWVLPSGITTNAQGIVSYNYNATAGSTISDVVFNAGSNPNANGVMWVLWSAGD